MEQPTFPQDREAWQTAVADGLDLPPAQAEAAYERGEFPYAQLAQWLQTTYSAEAGYSPAFVPALLRNIKGLVAWVYGRGSEPYWPGTDEDSTV